MTASAAVGEEARCLEAGMDGFLIEQVGFELLEATLVKWREGTRASGWREPSLAEDLGVLDLDRTVMLHALDRGHDAMFTRLVSTFIVRLPDDVAAIRSAVAAAGHVSIARAAHLLTGSGDNLGACAVGRACRAVQAHSEPS